jgi:hypothetical protein
MTISDDERRSWTQPGAQDAAQRTYASIRTALERSTRLAGLKFDVFLQGSYANDTNTRGDSDVDVVVMLQSAVYSDVSRLTPAEREQQSRASGPSTMNAATFRALVHAALVDYYGAARVHSKNKCLRVDKTAGYVDADVVPAIEHRLYTAYPAYGQASWIEGVAIDPLEGPRIVNYPKEHRKNGQAKNANGRCAGRYKPTVRQVKRLRRRAVEQGLVAKGAAPGYLLECLVYNVPDHLFLYDDSARLVTVVNWLRALSGAQLAATCKSGDEIHHLFLDDPGHHDPHAARQVLDALWKLL